MPKILDKFPRNPFKNEVINIGNFAHFLKHLRLRRIRKNTSMTRELGIGRIDLRFELRHELK